MKKIGCLWCSEDELNRRDFIRVGSLGFLGLGLGQLLAIRNAQAAQGPLETKAAKAEACILIWLEGGPSQVDTWDPKPNSNFKAIPTNVAGIQVSELLPQSARRMDKLSLIRSMHTEENNHPQATHYALTGHRPNPAMQFPSLGAIVAREMGGRNNLPAHLLVPQWPKERQYEKYFGSGFIGPEFNPMVVPDPNEADFQVADLVLPKSIPLERIENRRSFMKVWDQYHRRQDRIAESGGMDSFSAQALDMIMSPKVREAFDIASEPEEVRDRYGRNTVGQSVLLARRLVEAGSRFVTAAGYHANSWDSHQNNDDSHKNKLVPPLDQALAALLDDLTERGMLETTLVLVMGEFGRTPHINANLGRDHWPDCWSLALAGGGIQGGRVIGKSDERGGYIAEREVTMGDLYATVYRSFGIDWTKEYMHPIGRPIKIANSIGDKTGQPVSELL